MSSNRRLPPNNGVLTDDPADRSVDLTVSPDDILGPMLAPTEGLRGWVDSWRHGGPPGTPGVHPSVDDGSARSSQPGLDDDVVPGESVFQVEDPDIDSGLAEDRWNQTASRQRQGQWPR
jgi:hypothetical protein